MTEKQHCHLQETRKLKKHQPKILYLAILASRSQGYGKVASNRFEHSRMWQVIQVFSKESVLGQTTQKIGKFWQEHWIY